MKHIKLYESSWIKKIEPEHIRFFDLYPMLEGLEPERPGIKKRVTAFLKNENDIQFSLINNRLLAMNLYYYGLGDEYPTKSDAEEIEHSKTIHPEAFVSGTKEEALRLDFNLIWSTYDVDGDEVEEFFIQPNW